MKLGMLRDLGEKGYTITGDFRFLKENGFDFYEIASNFDSEDEILIGSVSEIKQCMADTGIPVGSLGRWNLPVNLGGEISSERLERSIRLLNTAAELGSPVYVCGCNYDESVSPYKNYGVAVKYFTKMTEEAAKLGITVAVYNCCWKNFVNTSKEWQIVLNEVPDLMIKYDPAHNRDYLTELNNWLPRIAHIHLKGVCDVAGGGVDAPPAGMDQIDWRSVFALIYRHGYDGGLSIEPHSDTWQGELGDRGILLTRDRIRPFILR